MKYSISTRISIVFAIALFLVCLLFATFTNLQKENAIEKLQDKQVSSINYLLTLYEKGSLPQDLGSYFRNFGLEYVDSSKFSLNIEKNGKMLFAKHTPIGLVSSILYENNLYLQIKNISFSILLESREMRNLNEPIWIIFILSTILLILLYTSVIKSLSPLKKLSKDIRSFASGDMQNFTNAPKLRENDEIGKVAYEFEKAACKIRELISSRQLFLRAIMHELKTPIGKGRIVSEMIENETQKTRLISIFEKLDILINEFSKIEQLLSKSCSLNYQQYHFSLILEQVSDMLMLENFKQKVVCKINDDVIINADFQLFSLAIKNLLDNALKYASDKKAILICEKDQIIIKNLGEKLEKPIKHYIQAFVRGESKKSGGLGLGLYIIDQICQMHKFKFEYEFKNNWHIFKIILRS